MLKLSLDKMLTHYTQDFLILLKEAQGAFHHGTSQFQTTRILVELGKQNPDMVLPLFKRILQQNSRPDLQWLAIYELLELNLSPWQILPLVETALYTHKIQVQNDTLLLKKKKSSIRTQLQFLIKQILQNNHPQTRWDAIKKLLNFSERYPRYCASLFKQALQSDDIDIQWFTALALIKLSGYSLKDFHLSNTKLPVISFDENMLQNTLIFLNYSLHSQQTELQWIAICDLLNISMVYPQEALPLLEKALNSNNAHVRWTAALGIIQLLQHHPAQVKAFFGKISLICQEKITIDSNPSLKSNNIKQVLLNFRQAWRNNNLKLQWASLYQLLQLNHSGTGEIIYKFRNLLRRELNREPINQSTRLLVEFGKIDPDAVIYFLHQAIHSNNPVLHNAALRELFALGMMQQVKYS